MEDNALHNDANISSRLDSIADKLDAINKTLKKNASASGEEVHKKEDGSQAEKGIDKHSSRVVLAAAISLLGMKLGGLIGAKIGLLTAGAKLGKDTWRQFKQASKDMMKNEASEDLLSNPVILHPLIGGGVGSFLGMVSGGLVGWTRGDRIEKPGDILAHPIESLEKIFASEPPKKSEDNAQENAKTVGKSPRTSIIATSTTSQKIGHEHTISQHV